MWIESAITDCLVICGGSIHHAAVSVRRRVLYGQMACFKSESLAIHVLGDSLIIFHLRASESRCTFPNLLRLFHPKRAMSKVLPPDSLNPDYIRTIFQLPRTWL